MTLSAAGRTAFAISLDMIDAPQLDARIDRDPEKLEELSRDILRRGLIEPIKVARTGERFEVVDGFRRYLATKAAGLETIECFIYETKSTALEGVKYAANIFREDMSPAEEAVMFFELYKTDCGEDIEKLAALVGKNVSYVDNRLTLLMGDALIFDALKQRQIVIGVAHALNEIPEADWRRYYLNHAIKSGATVGVVRGWVIEHKNLYGQRVDTPQPAAPDAATIFVATHDPLVCVICRKKDPRFIPEQVSVHTHCKLAVLDPILDNYHNPDGHS